MEFEPDLIQRGKAFDVSLPDYAWDAFQRLVAAMEAATGREVTEGEEHHLREVAEEAMAGLEAAEREAGDDSSRLVPIGEIVTWVREIQEMLEATAN